MFRWLTKEKEWEEGTGPVVSGGVLHASDGPQRLGVRCAGCGVEASVTLTLRTLEFSSPVMVLPVACDR